VRHFSNVSIHCSQLCEFRVSTVPGADATSTESKTQSLAVPSRAFRKPFISSRRELSESNYSLNWPAGQMPRFELVVVPAASYFSRYANF
jgi:hypothetical protein